MLNFNGKLINPSTSFLTQDNRAFKYGDAIFETISVKNKHIVFFEDSL